jgi:hypothetical protein
MILLVRENQKKKRNNAENTKTTKSNVSQKRGQNGSILGES